MTDFSGKGSRRVFAARLLREAQTQASTSTVNLGVSIAALPVGTLVATDRIPALAVAGTAKTLTPANFLAYILPDADKGDITTSASGATWTIDADAVTYAKMQNVSAASRLLGRGSAAGAGDPEELTIGTGLLLTGTVLSATATGDVVGPASATDNAVVRYDGTTGKLVKDSSLTLTQGISLNTLESTGVRSLTVSAGSNTLKGIGATIDFVPGTGGFAVRNSADTADVLNVDTLFGAVAVRSQSIASQFRVEYDGSNYLGILVSSAGAVTYDAVGASAGFSFSDSVNATEYRVSGTKVVGAQGATVTDPTGGTVQDSECRTAVIAIIDRLQAHGLIL